MGRVSELQEHTQEKLLSFDQRLIKSGQTSCCRTVMMRLHCCVCAGITLDLQQYMYENVHTYLCT